MNAAFCFMKARYESGRVTCLYRKENINLYSYSESTGSENLYRMARTEILGDITSILI